MTRTTRRRRGATLLEAAMVSLVFAFIVLGTIDLGVAVFRRNTIAIAARVGARHCVTHGSLAPTGWNGGPWGPATIDAAANSSGIPLVAAVQPMLTGIDLAQSRVGATWPDGGNNVNQRVRVTVSTPYRPILTTLLGGATITLTSSSTMTIAH